LQNGAHGCEHINRVLRSGLGEVVKSVKDSESAAHGFRARAEALVRQSLPRWKFQDFGVRVKRAQSSGNILGFAAG
jgi:hypothetical protein